MLEDGSWLGAVEGLAVRMLHADGVLRWQTYPERGRWDVVENLLALDVDAEALWRGWEEAVPAAAEPLRRTLGLRVLRQPAVEVLFGFVCATCNTVVKIERSVRALAELYGEPICVWDGASVYAFPTLPALAGADEGALRRALWGFRAPRVPETARVLLERGEGWLGSLRGVEYSCAHRALMGLPGLGAKVSDCVALFGLWHPAAVPVDTHVRRIAVELFHTELGNRSLTPGVYNTLADAMRAGFGEYAGWAQQALFYDAFSAKHADRP